jgi:hypothetical protein
MQFKRQHPRTTDTKDLWIRRRSSRPLFPHRVLNLSDGGLLMAGYELAVGDSGSFELVAPGFRSVCTGTATHRTGGATGLRFVGWEGEARERVHDLTNARIRRQQWDSVAATCPGCYLG